MKNLFTYLKNVRAELSHVVWPTRKQAALNTLLILIISVITALLIVLFDYIFTTAVTKVIGV
jgi:preprotein translocase subunit SecE